MPPLLPRTTLRSSLLDFVLGAAEYYSGAPRVHRYRQHRILKQQKQFHHPVKPLPVPELTPEHLSWDSLRALSNNFRSPVVIRQALEGSRAADLWSSDYLSEKCDHRADGIVRGKESQGSEPQLEPASMTLSDFHSSLKAGDRQLALELSSKVFTDAPELLADLKPNAVLKKTGLSEEFELTDLVLSLQSEGALTDLHAASEGSLSLHVKGKKTWVLLDPDYTPLLHARPRPVKGAWRKPFFRLDCVESFGKQALFLQNVPRYQTTLNGGDLLFNPAWWWHAVFSESSESITVTSRLSRKWWDLKLHQDPGLRNNPGYALLSHYLPVRLSLALGQLGALIKTGKTTSQSPSRNQLIDR